MISMGIISVLLLPNMTPMTFMTDFWVPMGANFIGQGIGSIVFGSATASKEVAEHNSWLARMSGNSCE